MLKQPVCGIGFFSVPVAPDDVGNHPPRNIKQAAEPPRTLEVEVLSSKSKVSVSVDGTKVGVTVLAHATWSMMSLSL